MARVILIRMAPRADMTVDHAASDDVLAIVTLINRAFEVERFFVDGDRIDAEEVTRLMLTGRFLLARGASAPPIGCVYVEQRGDRAYVGLLAVDPTCQKQGLGALLMNKAENRARSLGCRAVDIRVVNLRSELPPFYERLGYVACGEQPFDGHTTSSQPCHFILMTKPLHLPRFTGE